MISPTDRDRPGRGKRTPRNTLSAELIVDAALRMLDTKQCEEITMRTLAAELGVGTMTLYTYFRSKDDILQAARDRVLGAFHPPSVEGPWDDQVRACCRALYDLLIERPAVLRLLAIPAPGETNFGDTATTALELILRLLREAGLDRLEAARGYVALLQYTLGSALRHMFENDPAHDKHRMGALSPDAHPTITDLMPELLRVRENNVEQYAFGLDLILSGLRQRAETDPGDRR